MFCTFLSYTVVIPPTNKQTNKQTKWTHDIHPYISARSFLSFPRLSSSPLPPNQPTQTSTQARMSTRPDQTRPNQTNRGTEIINIVVHMWNWRCGDHHVMTMNKWIDDDDDDARRGGPEEVSDRREFFKVTRRKRRGRWKDLEMKTKEDWILTFYIYDL